MIDEFNFEEGDVMCVRDGYKRDFSLSVITYSEEYKEVALTYYKAIPFDFKHLKMFSPEIEYKVASYGEVEIVLDNMPEDSNFKLLTLKQEENELFSLKFEDRKTGVSSSHIFYFLHGFIKLLKKYDKGYHVFDLNEFVRKYK